MAEPVRFGLHGDGEICVWSAETGSEARLWGRQKPSKGGSRRTRDADIPPTETLWHISRLKDDHKAKATYLDLKGDSRMEAEATRGFLLAYLYI